MTKNKGGLPTGGGGVQKPENSSTGCAILAVIAVVCVVALTTSKCSPSGTSNGAVTEENNTAQRAIGTAIAAQVPPEVAALSLTSIKKGEAHLKAALVAGLPGEMIYSQNCYDALSRQFSWKKLDVCGAFDLAAVQALGDDEAPGFEKEAAWFQSEAAAGRYLKAAVSAGEDSSEADVRLNDLEARVSKVRVPAANDSTSNEVEGSDDDGSLEPASANQLGTDLGAG